MVTIVRRIGNSVIFDVEERKVHQTSIAALVSIRSGAINQLLLREGDKGSLSVEMSTFQ